MTLPNPALEILVRGLFDYSGMFPPESKTFEAALYDCARFNSALARPDLVNISLVLQRQSIEALSEEVLRQQGFQSNRKVSVAYLGSDIVDSTVTAIEEINFISRWNGQRANEEIPARIVSYEVKIADHELTRDALRPVVEATQKEEVLLCIEPNLATEWVDQTLQKSVAMLSGVRSASLKIRGTGPTGIRTDTISRVIEMVAEQNLHLKSTGGMHHPILERERYGNDLGFLNFAVAVVLKRVLGKKLPVSELKECLENADPAGFSFVDGIRWRNYQISMQELQSVKERFRMSIGSCSLREPDEDLQRLYG